MQVTTIKEELALNGKCSSTWEFRYNQEYQLKYVSVICNFSLQDGSCRIA